MFSLGNNPDYVDIDKEEPQPIQKAAAGKSVILLTTIFLFFYVGSEVSFGGWFFTFASNQHGITAADAALMNSFFWLAIALSRLLSVWVATRVSQDKILPVALLGAIGSLALIIVFPETRIVLWLMPVLFGFFMAPVFPTVFSWISEVINLNGRTTGILFFGDSAGAMLLPWIIGLAIDATSSAVMAPLLLASIGVNLAVFFVLHSTHRKMKAG
jgi:FHS family Na+ dependent glucose MFS transporter 1